MSDLVQIGTESWVANAPVVRQEIGRIYSVVVELQELAMARDRPTKLSDQRMMVDARTWIVSWHNAQLSLRGSVRTTTIRPDAATRSVKIWVIHDFATFDGVVVRADHTSHLNTTYEHVVDVSRVIVWTAIKSFV